ncbi:hypothetical protein [Halobacillus sp. BBL2006]|uniref:hypothetical protein n=1 Tax=Halobacillus sp. BBL2006 TaxID=1543706 RepID=UPI000B0E7AB2|nr:hypothetical protein [Halobacillus sp. BBL2006]
MYYLLFALFFAGYLVVGLFTDLVELSTVATVLSVALIFTNIYMYFKAKKEGKEQ